MEIISAITGLLPAISDLAGKIGLDLSFITNLIPDITALINQIIGLF